MTDYISREAAIEYLTLNMEWLDEDGYPVDDWDERKAHIADLINRIPAADVRPVVRGTWKPIDLTYGRSYYYCTACEETVDMPTAMGIPMFQYCPNCGARMEKS